MPFKCPYCSQYFCVQHRLPENHSCSEYWRAKSPLVGQATGPSSSKTQSSYQYNISGMSKQKKRRIIWFSGTEVKHLFIGTVLTLAIGFSMPLFGEFYLYGYPGVLTALAGIFACSFLVHELAHKLTAQHYGLWAEFRVTMFGALITLLSLISPFKIISPGAVMIGGVSDRRAIGRISIAGPLANIALALFFMVFLQALHGNTALVFHSSLMINSFIALFNLIPFGVLDGVKIFLWNKLIWAITFFVALLLTAYSFGYLQL